MDDDWSARTVAAQNSTSRDNGVESALPSPLTAKRQALIGQFAAWLDTVLEEEVPLGTTASELIATVQGTPLDVDLEPCDQFAIWSSLTALTQEVGLQGRAFKAISENMRPLESLAQRLDDETAVQQAVRALEASRADLERTVAKNASDAAWREILELLLDLRDRLCRNSEALQHSQAELRNSRGALRFQRWLSRVRRMLDGTLATIESLEAGNGLLIARLDEALHRLGVVETRCEGASFDPASMKAVEVECRSDLPEGAILAIHRRGYTWHGEIYRLAEVKVVRNPEKQDTSLPTAGPESFE